MANTVYQNTDDENEVKQKFTKLCQDLSIESNAMEDAWTSFTQIHRNVTLEGDSLHWLACALYVSCRKASLIREQLSMDGNIPLSKLLDSVKLSLLHFFQKVRKWLEMVKHGPILNEKIEQLERNFSVSSIVYEKYLSIFKELYKEDWVEQSKRARKRQALTTKDMYNFCWTLYIRTKAQYPDISDDLVNSYHLLLCCLDLTFSNIVCVKQLKTLINPEFPALPDDFGNRDYTSIENTSIIDVLCQLHEGLAIETKIIKRQYLGAFIQDLIKNNHLKGHYDKKTGLLDTVNFDANFKYLNDDYERHVLQSGNIDERIFIKEDSIIHIGTPTKRLTAFTDVDEKERSQVKRNLQDYFNTVKGFVPQTPLTGKRWLPEKASSESSITLSVSRIQELVKGLKPAPSDNMKMLFETLPNHLEEKLKTRLNSLSNIFLEEYSKPLGGPKPDTITSPSPSKDFAKARLHLALVLFYKTLEHFLEAEKKKSLPIAELIEQEIPTTCLFVCCLEIVIYSYNSSRVFPWVLQAFSLPPYYFFKVIELVIRSEDLSRDVIKHLSRIEEQILESLSWKTGSPIFAAIKSYGIPRCQDVSSDSNMITPLFFMSPTPIRLNKDVLGIQQQSPVLSLQNRFTTPTSPARRNLFGATSKTDSQVLVTPTSNKNTTAVILPPKITAQNQSPLSSVRFPIMLTSPSSSPVRLFAVTPQRGNAIRFQASPNKGNSKKFGSLGIFFRKLYHMSSVRMKDLCDKLGIGAELQKKIWTCYEHNLVENIDMLRDRHIDQLLMCAVYVMSKVTKEDKSFHEIMKWYRTQPQATSDVYRRVLTKRAGDVEGSTNSPDEDEEDVPPVTVVIKENGSSAVDESSNTVSEEKNIYYDLIQFYNIVYIKKIKDFALKFATNKTTLDAPPLSPLPVTRKQVHSPRKVSKQYSVYISPIKPSVQMTPRSKLLYCFDSDSPKKLNEINAMVKGGTRRRVILDTDDDTGPTAPKRPMNGLAKRAQELRQEQINHNRGK